MPYLLYILWGIRTPVFPHSAAPASWHNVQEQRMWQGIWRKKKLIIYLNCHHGTAALLLNMASPATRKDIIDSSTSTSASQQIGAEWKNYHTPSPSTFERNKKPTFGTIAKGNSRHILSYRNHRLLLLLFSFFPFPPFSMAQRQNTHNGRRCCSLRGIEEEEEEAIPTALGPHPSTKVMGLQRRSRARRQSGKEIGPRIGSWWEIYYLTVSSACLCFMFHPRLHATYAPHSTQTASAAAAPLY